MSLAEAGWRRENLSAGLAALAAASRVVGARTETVAADEVRCDQIEAAVFIARQAARLGFRAEAVGADYAGLATMLRNAAPAIVRIATDESERFFLLAGVGRGDRLKVLGPDFTAHTMAVDDVVEMMVGSLVAKLPTDIEGCITDAGIPQRRRGRARRAMLEACLRGVDVEGAWLLRAPRTGAWWTNLRRDGLVARTSLFVTSHVAQIAIGLIAWGFIARLTFTSEQAPAWLWALLLALLTLIPFQLLGGWAAGLIALDFGARLKQRLLVGALDLSLQEVRADGVGQHFSRVVESEAFEALLLTGAATGATAFLELLASGTVMVLVGSTSLCVLLLVWVIFSAFVFVGYLRSRRAWSQKRLGMTHALVEGLIGHQTRLAQEAETTWHLREDAGLAAYQATGKKMDGWQILLSVLVVRGWLPVGLAGLLPSFVSGHSSEILFTIGLGAVLLAQRAITQMSASGRALGEAFIAWQLVKPLFAAAKSAPEDASSLRAQSLLDSSRSTLEADTLPVLEAQNLSFAYDGRAPTLRDVTCSISKGDCILLEGESGGGKSTLASLLAGLQTSSGGLIFLHGIDRSTLGATEWRRRVVLAPQFHDNHIFTGTLAFNLLMGGRWPPNAKDIASAEAICRDLELGPLLDRMPNGVQQVVGETGWQLSHGERSRVFLGRALLQDADILILDESFAALDPHKLLTCLSVLLAQQRTIVLIAHP